MISSFKMKKKANLVPAQFYQFFYAIYTPCHSTPAESTPERSPVKVRPTKSVPGEKSLGFLPPRCVLAIWVSLRVILSCWCSPFLKFSYFPGDIAQTIFGPWLTSASFKIYAGYKQLLYNGRFHVSFSSVSFSL